MDKAIIIILLYALAIGLIAADSESITLLLATKAAGAAVMFGACKLYDKWEPELNQPVKED